MRRYEYSVGDGSDIDAMLGRRTYTVLCRSWDDFDQDAESWVRVVNWYTNRATAQVEADALQANANEARESLRRANEDARAWQEYDGAAHWCAERGHTGERGSRLPDGLSTRAAELIDADPEAFADRVRDHAYARSMQRVQS